MSDVALIVNGRRYGGWKSVRVTNSIESLAGSFDLDVNDRWADQDVPWPIAEEDECRVEIDGQVVIDGYVDQRRLAIDATSRSLGYSGRDKAGELVDCSAVLDRWTFRKASVLDIARAVAEPFGISVSLQPGLVLAKPLPRLVVNPGDTAFQVIERAAQPAGVLVVSDGAGGLLITRSGTGRAAPLVMGQNIKSASVEYVATDRFHRYVVATQIAGTDQTSGDATRIRAESIDEGVQRQERVLLVIPESGVTTDYARRRADWEARIRAARAETVSVGVIGWKQPNGSLWPINAQCYVQAHAIGVDGNMVIASREFSIDESGELTTLSLVRPDAFTPEPQAVVKRSGAAYKDQAGNSL